MTDSKSIFTLDGSLCCDSDLDQLTDDLTSIDGVEEARGDISSNRVTVTYRDNSVSEVDITETIDEVGLSVEDTVTFDVSG